MPNTAFITGATGLVGAKLVFDLYKKNYSLVVLKRKSTSISKLTRLLKFYTNEPDLVVNHLKIIDGDVTDVEVLSDNIFPDYDVYHCAAMVSFNPKQTEKLYETNVGGTTNLVNVCLSKKVRKFCQVSSIGALGTSVNGGKIDVDSPWSRHMKSPYSVSKHESELEVWRGIAEGLNAVIVNPAVILGAGDWNSSSAALFSTIAKGMKYYTQGSTAYVCVNDVCKAMIELMESDICNRRFILAAESLSYKKVFKLIAEGLKVKAPYKLASPMLTAIVWRIEHLRMKILGGEPKITKYTHKVAHKHSEYNGQPIVEDMNFEYTPIIECIREICKKYLEK